jgi:hypothetical protein
MGIFNLFPKKSIETDKFNNIKNFGNDVAALVKTYSHEIDLLHHAKRSNLKIEQIKLFFVAYAIARNFKTYNYFKDKIRGKELLKIFIEDLISSFETINIVALDSICDDFKLEINKNSVNFDKFFIEIYNAIGDGTASEEELLWVRNFTKAISNQNEKYHNAAVNLGFI